MIAYPIAPHTCTNAPYFICVPCKSYAFCRLANERELLYEALGADVVARLGNFLDNHDFPRFLELQPDHALFKNGLAWVLLSEGIPIVYYGSAAGMRGGTEGNRHRECLWDRPYDTQSDLYRMIGTLSK